MGWGSDDHVPDGHIVINSIASWATIFSGFGIPLIAAAIWMLRRLRKAVHEEVEKAKKLIRDDVVPKLTNDDTTAAQYAHQGVDIATRALEMAVVTDARLRRVEDKLDNYILAQMASKNG